MGRIFKSITTYLAILLSLATAIFTFVDFPAKNNLKVMWQYIFIIAACICVIWAILKELKINSNLSKYIKAGLKTVNCVIVGMIVLGIYNWVIDTEQLPSIVQGKLKDESGNPVTGAVVRLVSEKGIDITKGEYYETDSKDGTYVIASADTLHRNDFIRIILDTSKPDKFQQEHLFRKFERDGIFNHEIHKKKHD